MIFLKKSVKCHVFFDFTRKKRCFYTVCFKKMTIINKSTTDLFHFLLEKFKFCVFFIEKNVNIELYCG